MTLNILKIIPDTIVDGPRIRTSLYLSGCSHHCQECHNPLSWKPNSGTDIEFDEIIKLIKEFDHNHITISGGDGLCYQYLELIEFLKYIKKEIPEINIWVYTGYTYEELIKDKNRKEILNYIDVLVDGKFIKELLTKDKLWVGSSNQRVIDINKTLKEDKIIEIQ